MQHIRRTVSVKYYLIRIVIEIILIQKIADENQRMLLEVIYRVDSVLT